MPPRRASPLSSGRRRAILAMLLAAGIVVLLVVQLRSTSVPVVPGPEAFDPEAVAPTLAPAPPPAMPTPQKVSAPSEPLTRATGFFGRVEDPAGRPIGGARVRVLASAIPGALFAAPTVIEGAETTTDADGRFLVGPVPARGVWLTVEARAEGRATAQRRVALRGANVVLVLGAAASLKVSVRDPQKESIAGARVQALAGNAMEESTTNAAGDALLAGLAPGAVELFVSAPGRGPVKTSAMLAQTAEVAHKTVVLGPGVALAVRVVDENDAPVPGVGVHLEDRLTGGQEEVGRTDARGRLTIPSAGGPGDTLFLSARRAGGDEATTVVTLAANAGAAEGSALLRLTATGVELTGDVTDLEGRPVAGATVVFVPRGFPRWNTWRTAASDAAGHFALPAPDATVWPVAAISPRDGIANALLSPGVPGRLSVKGAGRVEGTIVDEKGNRLEGALLVLEPEVPFDADLGWFLSDPRVRALRTGVSDAAGTWACPGVPAGAYRVSASWGQDLGTDLAALSVVGGGAERRDLVLPTGLALVGQVVSTGGTGVVGASVTAWPEQGRMPADARPRTTTDAEGRFELRGVSPGRWTVEASAAGHVMGQDPSVLVPSQRALVRLMELGSFGGVVEDPEGAPYAAPFDVRVTASPGGASEGRGDGRDDESPRTFSTGDGTFRITGFPAGTYRVDVRTPSGLRIERPVEVVVQDGQEAPPLRLRLRRGASIRGTLRTADGDKPIAEVEVEVLLGDFTVEGTQDARFGAVTDAEGRWSVAGLGLGTWRVIARAPHGRFAEARLALEWGQEVETSLVAPRTGRLVVLVKDPKGEPVAGARVTVESERGTSLLDDRAYFHSTDARGRWASDEVPAVRVKVRVSAGKDPGTFDDRETDVPADGEATVDITFRSKLGGAGPR